MTTPLLRRPAAGFTLMELMIALSVVAILVRLMVPIYTQQAQEARRTDAKNALIDLAAREEKFYATNNQYTNDFSKLGYSGTTSTTTSVALPATGTSDYSLGFAAQTTSSYTASAIPVNNQASDACGAYEIADTGVQSNWQVTSGAISSTAITGLTCW